VRTSNRKGRHLSTIESIRLLEDYGIDTPEGFVQAPKGILTKPTANRYLKRWGYDHVRLTREPPAVRFQARYSNDLWQFDISPSDLKHIKAPRWVDDSKGEPVLMLYSVVDDRSGVAYQEYHYTYGEDVEAALRFLFNAMAPKGDERSLFQGRPVCLLADPGPVARSHVFQRPRVCGRCVAGSGFALSRASPSGARSGAMHASRSRACSMRLNLTSPARV
jgi:hypothetical protein